MDGKGTVFLVTLIIVFCAIPVQAQALERLTVLQVNTQFPPAVPGISQTEASGKLRTTVGKSIVVNSSEPLARVSVTDPAIASTMIVSPRQVLIHGLAPGSVTLLLWDNQEGMRSFDLVVEFDVSALQQTIRRDLPGESIQVEQSGSSIVLTGSVSSQQIAERAVALAQTQSKNAVNLLVTVERKDAVLLQVRLAEVDRAAIQQLGLNIFSTGAANTLGSVSTQQFEQLLGNVGSVPSDVQRGKDPQSPNVIAGGIGAILKGSPAVFGLSDLLNVFVFRPDLNLGLTIKALEQRNLLQILAEPNVLALNGREASFLAGGEFPFPVVQGGTNFTAVTIQFREFGVRLKFTPFILSEGKIRLKVAPEVSSLDFSNALTVSGFLVPAISTRRVETEVELRDGESFAIAGLIDNRSVVIASKIPALGDIPFLGKLFRSRQRNRSNTELLVVVTPRLVKPLAPGETPPSPVFPKPFLDKEKFDSDEKPGGPERKGP